MRRDGSRSIDSGARGRGDGPTARLGILAAVVAAAAAMSAADAPAATRCTLAKLADLPIRVVGNKLVAEGAVNGQKVGIMLDTGASASLITRATADRLKLGRQKARGAKMFGVGGEFEIETALVDELKVGDTTAQERYLVVGGDREIGDGVDVVLGEDFFRAVDVEFDLAHNAIRLFKAKDCEATSLAYWAPDLSSEVMFEHVNRLNPRIVLAVEVNGHPVRAQLDSGRERSVLDRTEAARAGVGGTGAGPASSAAGASLAPVQSLSIGELTFKGMSVEVADLSRRERHTARGSEVPQNFDSAPMLLGIDVMRQLRVLVAHSQRKLYFTYLGTQGQGAAGSRGESGRAPE